MVSYHRYLFIYELSLPPTLLGRLEPPGLLLPVDQHPRPMVGRRAARSAIAARRGILPLQPNVPTLGLHSVQPSLQLRFDASHCLLLKRSSYCLHIYNIDLVRQIQRLFLEFLQEFFALPFAARYK
jgi:hypothetical protein